MVHHIGWQTDARHGPLTTCCRPHGDKPSTVFHSVSKARHIAEAFVAPFCVAVLCMGVHTLRRPGGFFVRGHRRSHPGGRSGVAQITRAMAQCARRVTSPWLCVRSLGRLDISQAPWRLRRLRAGRSADTHVVAIRALQAHCGQSAGQLHSGARAACQQGWATALTRAPADVAVGGGACLDWPARLHWRRIVGPGGANSRESEEAA